MEGFITSRPARVACIGIAMVLLGGGLATHLTADMELWVASAGAFLGVGIGLLGMAWFSDDSFASLLGVIVLPIGLLLLMPMSIYIAFFEKDYGDVLLVVSTALAFWGLRPARRVRALAAERRLRVV